MRMAFLSADPTVSVPRTAPPFQVPSPNLFLYSRRCFIKFMLCWLYRFEWKTFSSKHTEVCIYGNSAPHSARVCEWARAWQKHKKNTKHIGRCLKLANCMQQSACAWIKPKLLATKTMWFIFLNTLNSLKGLNTTQKMSDFSLFIFYRSIICKWVRIERKDGHKRTHECLLVK